MLKANGARAGQDIGIKDSISSPSGKVIGINDSILLPSRQRGEPNDSIVLPTGQGVGQNQSLLSNVPSGGGLNEQLLSTSRQGMGQNDSLLSNSPTGWQANETFLPDSSSRMPVNENISFAPSTGMPYNEPLHLLPPKLEASSDNVDLLAEQLTKAILIRSRDSARRSAAKLLIHFYNKGSGRYDELIKITGYTGSGLGKLMTLMRRKGLIQRKAFQQFAPSALALQLMQEAKLKPAQE